MVAGRHPRGFLKNGDCSFISFFLTDPKYVYGVTMANGHAGMFKIGCGQIHPSFFGGVSRDISFPNFLVYLLFKRSAKRPSISVRTLFFLLYFVPTLSTYMA
jgi:hypothetical protein